MYQVKVVTLKGHVISKTGSMTGGTNGRDGTDRWEEKVNKINKTCLDSSMMWHGLVWCMQQLKFLIFIIAFLPDSNDRCYASLLYLFNFPYNPNFDYRKTSISRKLTVYGKEKRNWRKVLLRTNRQRLQDSRYGVVAVMLDTGSMIFLWDYTMNWVTQ